MQTWIITRAPKTSAVYESFESPCCVSSPAGARPSLDFLDDEAPISLCQRLPNITAIVMLGDGVTYAFHGEVCVCVRVCASF